MLAYLLSFTGMYIVRVLIQLQNKTNETCTENIDNDTRTIENGTVRIKDDQTVQTER